jgi:siroheme synthase
VSAPLLLVGAGPGAADLLTLRAELALGDAGTVLADAAVAPLARGFGAEVVVVDGVAAGAVVELVRGARPPVVRLYRGDPWLHPAHAAERDALTAAGIATEAVPGVSVAVGTATAAGRPTHHRGVSVAARIDGEHVEAVGSRRG